MQLVRLTVGGGDRSVPLARRNQGVVAHGRHQVIKADGRFVVVSAWKDRADVLDPSHSIRVHVNADCRVAFLAYEDMPSRKGGPVIAHVHCVHGGDEPLYIYTHTCKHMLCSTQHTFTMSSTSDMSWTSIGSLKMRKRFLSIPKTRSIILRSSKIFSCTSCNASQSITGGFGFVISVGAPVVNR
jgi:hypothetical protein